MRRGRRQRHTFDVVSLSEALGRRTPPGFRCRTLPRQRARTPSDDAATRPIPHSRTTLRTPTTTDASAIWRTARDSGTLDLNSPYAYLLLCHHHAETCLVAEIDGAVAGFVVGYRPPQTPDAVFVWQVAVSEAHRGLGLAGRLLDALLSRTAPMGVRYLEATVTPSNQASRRLFSSVAERFGTRLEVSDLFDVRHFPVGDHEDEQLFRIGPLPEPAGPAPATPPDTA